MSAARYTLASLFSLAACTPTLPTQITSTPVQRVEVPSNLPERASLRGESLRLVTQMGGSPAVILEASPEESWARGEARIVYYEDGEMLTRKDVEYSALPADLFGWLTQEVKLFNGKEEVCEGSVKRLSMRGSLYISDKEYPFGRDAKEDPMTQEELTQAAWESSSVWLVAELSTTGEGCEEALFARLSELPAPAQARPEDAPESLKDLAIDRLHKLPAFAELKSDFESYSWYGEGATTEELEAERADRISSWQQSYASSAEVNLFKATDGTTLVFASVYAGGGCGDFDGGLWALWKVVGSASTRELQLISSARDFALWPTVIVDADGNGTWELLERQSVFGITDGSYEVKESVYVPYDVEMCPC